MTPMLQDASRRKSDDGCLVMKYLKTSQRKSEQSWRIVGQKSLEILVISQLFKVTRQFENANLEDSTLINLFDVKNVNCGLTFHPNKRLSLSLYLNKRMSCHF